MAQFVADNDATPFEANYSDRCKSACRSLALRRYRCNRPGHRSATLAVRACGCRSSLVRRPMGSCRAWGSSTQRSRGVDAMAFT